MTSLNRDIAYASGGGRAHPGPIPGRSAIRVEVPNHTRQLVGLADIMTSPEAKAATHPLDVAIGKDIAGRSVFLNLSTTAPADRRYGRRQVQRDQLHGVTCC